MYFCFRDEGYGETLQYTYITQELACEDCMHDDWVRSAPKFHWQRPQPLLVDIHEDPPTFESECGLCGHLIWIYDVPAVLCSMEVYARVYQDWGPPEDRMRTITRWVCCDCVYDVFTCRFFNDESPGG